MCVCVCVCVCMCVCVCVCVSHKLGQTLLQTPDEPEVPHTSYYHNESWNSKETSPRTSMTSER